MKPVLLAALVAVLVVLSACGVAKPLGVNRTSLPLGIANRQCWPLPHRTRFDFPVQEVDDVLVGHRRLLTLQYDRVDTTTALASAQRALSAGGFTPAAPPSTGATAGLTWYRRSAWGYLGMSVAALPDLPAGSLVRGTLVLNLPESTWHRRLAGICTSPRLPSADETPSAQLPGVAS